MAQCEQCGNFDDQEIENDDGIFDLGKRPKRRKGYQPDLYFYWHGDIEEDYDMGDYTCLCEICFDINNSEGKIKWIDDKDPFQDSNSMQASQAPTSYKQPSSIRQVQRVLYLRPSCVVV